MTIPDPFPSAWGTTRVLELVPYQPGRPWDPPSWDEVVLPPSSGELRHGRDGSISPETVVITVDDAAVALADSLHVGVDHLEREDREYYQCLRLRAILDATRWRTLPWPLRTAGELLLAWDKFHGHVYVRDVDDELMSFGASWAHLEAVALARHPR